MKLASNKTRILLNLFVPQRRKPNTKHAIQEKDKDLSGKTIVFTGGTDGIGRVAVEMLYKMGANIVLLARNKTKGEDVIREPAGQVSQNPWMLISLRRKPRNLLD